MLRRLRLPGKLAIAALPLVLLLVAAATLFTLRALDDADQQEYTAELAATWEPLRNVIDVFAAEEAATLVALDELVAEEMSAMRGAADLTEVRSDTDTGLADLRGYISELGDPTAIVNQFEVAELAVGAVRAFFDESGTSPSTQRVRIPEGYDLADAQILEIGDFIVAEVDDVELARDLVGVAALSRALQSASIQDRTVDLLEADDRLSTNLETIRRSGVDVSQWLSSFESTTDPVALEQYRDSGLQQAVFDASRFSGEITRAGERAPGAIDGRWSEASQQRGSALLAFQRTQIDTVIDQAQTAATDVRTQAFGVLAVAAIAVIAAASVTALVSRSIVSRVRTITESAKRVTQTQLPALVEALRDPSDDVVLPSIPPIRDRGADEVGDLARSFSAMQSTLEHVATQQIEVLRKGVADMFVTLARRNRSLIDRQLAMIDTLERNEENPETLADFYKLDHLATRMRRNAESLLVLAGTEPQKRWQTPLEADDVVRAALGEVEDYRRIDVLALEAVRLNGVAVVDLAHLLSELLENATSFSPPETRVRIAGHFHDEGYLVTVTDRGVGVPARRLTELNDLLARPPVVGLALEPTLGLYVVAMLAKRHGIRVRLVHGAPGLTAHVMIPKSLFEVEANPTTRRDVDVAPTPRRLSASEPARLATEPLPERHLIPTAAPTPVPVSAPLPAPTPAPTPAPVSSDVIQPAADGRPPRSYGEDEFRTVRHTAPTHQPPEQRTLVPSSVGTQNPPASGSEERFSLTASGLPTRKPGTSFTAPEVTERPVDNSERDPEQIKSAFSSFQLGVTIGRNTTQEGAQHE